MTPNICFFYAYLTLHTQNDFRLHMVPNSSKGTSSMIMPASLMLWMDQYRTTRPWVDIRAGSRASISTSQFGEDIKINKGIKYSLDMDSSSPAAAWSAAVAAAGCGLFD